MGQHVRKRPDIQANNAYLQPEQYRMCAGDKCKNVVAVGVKSPFCSRCRRKERR